jgi:hypothetical protein
LTFFIPNKDSEVLETAAVALTQSVETAAVALTQSVETAAVARTGKIFSKLLMMAGLYQGTSELLLTQNHQTCTAQAPCNASLV